MAKKKFVTATFKDEAILFPAVKRVRMAGYKIHDVYTPFPVHGLDYAMGLRETSLHTAGFIYACTGTTTALTGISWILTKDWPLNFGGKPHFSLPAWIPITFELTVLFASIGMVLTFCYLCQMAPFVKKHRFHLRATDDTFTMVIECTAKTNVEEAKAFINQCGAEEVIYEEAEAGWWLGTYDKDQQLIKESEPVPA